MAAEPEASNAIGGVLPSSPLSDVASTPPDTARFSRCQFGDLSSEGDLSDVSDITEASPEISFSSSFPAESTSNPPTYDFSSLDLPDKLSVSEKIRITRALWRHIGIDHATFVSAWLRGADLGPRSRQVARRRKAVEKVTSSAGIASVEPVIALLSQELDRLVGRPFFGRFKPEDDLGFVDFSKAYMVLSDEAPTWTLLLSSLARNRLAGRASYQARQNISPHHEEIYVISSMMTRCRARKSSNYFAKNFGLYLASNGAKRRLIETCAGFGLCDTYKWVNKTVVEIAKQSQNRMKKLCRQPNVFLAYDNFNFVDNIRDQRLGHSKPVQRNLTSALLITSPTFPPGGLWQSMFDCTRPLSLDGIMGRLRKGPGLRQLGKHFIASAIRQVHPNACRSIFDSADAQFAFPGPPVWEPLPSDPSILTPLGAIFYDEGRLDGTYKVHEDIFLRKFGFNVDADFDERLWIVQGDQKTAAFIRRLKAHQYYASRAYDRRRWMIAPPAFFHILQNFILAIVRSHFEAPSRSNSMATLLHDVGIWQRYGIARDNAKFHLMEPLLTQGWTGRILACFYTRLIRDGHIPSTVNITTLTPEDCEQYVKNIDAGYFHTVLEEIYRGYMMKPAWDGVDATKQPIRDSEFTSMCRYLQEVEFFMFVRHAVRHGDIGLMDELIDLLGVWFRGAGQTNYALEMLHLRWLLDSSSPELRRAILTSSVVNPSGKPGKFKATDLAVEHLNCFYRLDLNMRKNSTHDAEKTFGRLALASPVFATIRSSFESFFGERTDGKHSHKRTVGDIFHLATAIITEHRTHPRLDSQLPSVPHCSPDLLNDGVADLNKRVNAFNDEYINAPDRATTTDLGFEGDPLADPADPSLFEYVQETQDTLHGMLDEGIISRTPTSFHEELD